MTTELDHQPVVPSLIMNTYETEVSVVKYEEYDDMIGKYGPCPPGCVPIIDAEMDLVAFVPADKAHAIASILNGLDSWLYPDEHPDR